MKSQNLNKVLPLCAGVLVLSVIVGYTILAWTEPTLSPPEGNVAAPINTGTVAQMKNGDLGSATKLCIGGDCRASWPGIVVSSCSDPANQWVTGIGADGKVICQTTPGGPTISTPCTTLPPGNNKRMFVTSSSYTGYQVQTVSLADAICQNHASAVKMGGTYKALMYYAYNSYGSIVVVRNPYDVLKLSNGFWNCGEGGTVWNRIASNPSEFFTKDGTSNNYLENPIKYNEMGTLTSATVWTNFKPTGSGSWEDYSPSPWSSDNCKGVCTARYTYQGQWIACSTRRGNSTLKNVGWADYETGDVGDCMNQSRAIYCVEQ